MIAITILAAVERKLNTRKEMYYSSNLTFSKLCTINIGKYFLRLIDKHFNGNNLLNKITGKQSKTVILALIFHTKSLATII